MQKSDMNTKGSGKERERALLNFGILDTEPEGAYDELARLAAYVCKTPIALITFIDKDREWIKSAVGIEISTRDIPNDMSFGVRMIAEPEEFLAVFNPAGDESLRANPILQNQTNIGFYAGVPLKDRYGNKIGSLCVLGYKPKDLSYEQLSLLETTARQVMLKLEQRTEQRDKKALIELNKEKTKNPSSSKAVGHSDAGPRAGSQHEPPESGWAQAETATHKRGAEQVSLSETEISDWVYKLEKQSKELLLLCEMDELLQAANSDHDIYTIVKNYAQKLFPKNSGAVYVLNEPMNMLQDVAIWGEGFRSEHTFVPDNCWGLRLGRIHSGSSSSKELYCQHILSGDPFNYLCAPLSAGTKALGLLFIQDTENLVYDRDYERLISSDKQYLLSTIAKHSGLALANLMYREKLGTQAVFDSLTGLFNRRYMEETLKRELSRVTRKNDPLGLIMADIDHFKQFNDSYGHAAGDALLKSVGSFLKEHVRREDIACRYGGEEFVLILPESSLENTRKRAEQLREEIKQLRIWHHGSLINSVKVSMGVVVFSEHGTSAESLLESADKALYRAKEQGRDRIEIA